MKSNGAKNAGYESMKTLVLLCYQLIVWTVQFMVQT